MLFGFKRMRAAADFLPEGGAGVRPYSLGDGPGGGGGAPGMQTMGRADGERAGDSGRGESRPLGASGGASARPAGRRFGGADEEPDSGLDAESEVVEEAQQNEGSGVEEDMATLVLDNAALGVRPGMIPGTGPGGNPELHAAAADPNSDAAIMLRVAAGDEAGFNYLVEKYHRAMTNFLYRMVHNQAVAEELAQEVFLRVYRSRESYRAEAKFTTWLYRIATNLGVNHARDTKHERAAQNVYLDVPDEETGTTPEVADDRPSAEQALLKNERMGMIRKHVMALPERQRSAVLMHKYQGMDYRQIGEVLKLSESATKSLLFRAYQTLREKLKEFV
jgi:RNA polymerase sigma-70 factor (ECF subfamily)